MTVKRSFFSFWAYWLLVNIFLIVVLIIIRIELPTSSIIGIGVILNVLMALSLLGKFQLKRLTLGKEEQMLTVELDKWFFISRVIKIPLKDAKLTFQIENRTRGLKVSVFRIFFDNKLIIEAVPGLSGWSEKDLRQICDLNNSIKVSTP